MSDDSSDYDTSDNEEEEEEEENAEEEHEKINSSKKVPKDIVLTDEVFDVSFHPTKEVMATGEISGKVCLYAYTSDEECGNKKLLETMAHPKACRKLAFSAKGDRLYTSSKDKSIHILDLDSGKSLTRIEKAHEKAINCLCVTDNVFASGSDDGVVKMWDNRTYSQVAEFSDFKDFISDMTIAREKFLLCTSGDGILSILNLRKRALEHVSDQLDEELLCVDVMKNGTKVVCGSGDGILNIYNWGEWGDISDRIPMDGDSIDAICPLNDDILFTGIGNGRIDGWFILPHKRIGSLGCHGKIGVQSLTLSSDKGTLASSAGEKTVKFWDVSEIKNLPHPSANEKSNNRKRKLDKGETEENNDFFNDL